MFLNRINSQKGASNMYSNIIAAHDYIQFFEDQITSFGGVNRGNKKYVLRKNANQVKFLTQFAFF